MVGRLWEVHLSYIVVWGKSVATIAPSDSPVKEIFMYVWLVNFSMHIFKVNNLVFHPSPPHTNVFLLLLLFFQLYWSKPLLN